MEEIIKRLMRIGKEQRQPVDTRPIIVIAENYRQYTTWLRETRLDPGDARYVDRPEQLCGLRGVRVVRTGRWWKSPVIRDSRLRLLDREDDEYRKAHGI